MITRSDSPNTLDIGDYYAILGSDSQNQKENYLKQKNAKKVDSNFAYDSGTNEEFLSVEQIRSLIKRHINPDFSPI